MTDEGFLKAMQALYPAFVRVGKVSGQVRMQKDAWDALRAFVCVRDGSKCVDCGSRVVLAKGHWASVHCAHIKSKGSGGSDLPSNLLSKCINCHDKAHHTGKHARPGADI